MKKRRLVKVLGALTAGILLTSTVTSCQQQPVEEFSIPDSVYDMYYFDSSDVEYVLSMNSGKFTLNAFGFTYKGTVSGEEESNGIKLTLEFDNVDESLPKETATAIVSNGVVSLTFKGKTYDFVKRTSYTVSFVSSGSSVASSTVLNGRTLDMPVNPTKDGYSFIGWYTSDDYSKPYDFSSKVTSSFTLYARFVPVSVGQTEYQVSFVNGDNTVKTMSTVNGVLYDLPVLKEENKTFVGWWVSNSNDPNKLTYQYTNQVLKESMNLYAVFEESGKANVSVSSTGVSWTAVGVNASYSVKITSPSGVTNEATVNTTSYSYDFTNKEAGEFKVEVTTNNVTSTSYYLNKALDRVSVFNVVEPGLLMFNKVAGATQYLITVDCGDSSHNHTEYNLGSSTFFDFTNCLMQKGGIKFSVKAVGAGFVSSVSETFVYDKQLSSVDKLAIANDEVLWNFVQNATGYTVVVEKGEEEFTFNVGNTTSFSLKEFTGALKVSVYPTSNGYNSGDPVSLDYTKSSLSSPLNISVDGKTVSWDEVTGATGYTVKVGANEYNVSEGTSFTFNSSMIVDGKTKYEVSVKAKGESASNDSLYSDIVNIDYNSMSDEISYSNGEVSWGYVLGASYYAIKVNNGKEFTVSGTNKTPVTLKKAGVNTISVAYYDENGMESEFKSITVNAQAVYYSPENGEDGGALYYAAGDKVTMPEVEYDGYELAGWYNVPFGPENNGVLYNNGFSMPSSTVILYAYWAPKTYEITLVTDIHDETKNLTGSATYTKNFTLPVAENKSQDEIFGGWYTEPNGQGKRIADGSGNSLAAWAYKSDKTLYAFYVPVLEFTPIYDKDGAVASYSASQGAGISYVTEVTIPSTYTDPETQTSYKITELGSFTGCNKLVTLNIPDTISYIDVTLGFTSCYKLEAVNVYNADPNSTYEKFYTSFDGALYHNNITSDNPGWEIVYFPYAKAGEYTIMPGTVEIPLKVFYSADFTKITIPYTVTAIRSNAFYLCTYLTDIVFELAPDGVEEKDLTIEAEAFKSCSKIVNMQLPTRLTNFDSTMFTSCYKLENVNFVGTGGNYASYDGIVVNAAKTEMIYCPVSRTGEFTIPSGYLKVNDNAFKGCTKLTKLIVPGYVTFIGESAFHGCTGLTEIEFQGDATLDTLEIGKSAFYGCSSLSEIELKENIRKVGEFAFGGTTKLTKVTVLSSGELDFAKGVTRYTSTTDTGSSYVKELHIGANVPVIDINAVFSGSNDVLASVNVDPSNTNYKVLDEVIFDTAVTRILFYPSYKAGNYVLPSTVTTISSGVFRRKSNLTSFVIPATITAIEDEAFYYCSKLTSIVFEATKDGETPVELTIGKNAFGYCSSLTELELPVRTTEINDYAFRNCSYITKFVIPEGVTKMGTHIFYYGTRLQEVVIPASLESIDTATWFTSCSALSTITVSKDNKIYATYDGVLYSKTKEVLTSLVYCPQGRTGQIVVPKTVKEIAAKAFYQNSKLNSITFEDNMSAYDEETKTCGQLTVGENAFYYCRALTSLSLPNISEIPAKMLYYCDVLESFEIAKTVKTIGNQAFYYCKALTNLTFEAGGTEELTFTNATSITYSPFYSCGIESITFPERTKSLGNFLFRDNTSIQIVNIPSSLKSIGTNCFYGCTNLIEVNVPEDSQITKIDNYAFYKATFTNFNMPSGLLTTGTYAFAYCNIEEVKLPNTVTALGNYTFYNCPNLVKVNIPQKTTLGTSLFYGCSKLKTVEFEANSKVKVLSNSAFRNCTSLEEISLPNSITEIGTYVFSGCTNLKSINFEEKTLIAKIGNYAFSASGLNKFSFPTYYKTLTATSPSAYTTLGGNLFNGCVDLKEVYLSASVANIDNMFAKCFSIEKITIADGNDNFKLDDTYPMLLSKDGSSIKYVFGKFPSGACVIPSTITSISDYAFQGQSSIISLVIPDTVESVGKYAFENCSSLTRVEYYGASSLTEIPDYCFQSCTNLREFVYGENITKFGHYAFSKCSSLNVDNMSFEGVKYMGQDCFSYCNSMTKFTIPTTLNTIGTYLFRNSKSLKTVTFPEGATLITTGMFYGCDSIGAVTLPSTIKEIMQYAFEYSGVTKITLPDSVTTMGTYVFAFCDKLVECNIGAGLKALPNDTFYKATALEKVTLPETMTWIGTYAFTYAESLKEIVLPTELTGIGGFAFEYSGIENIVIPEKVIQIGGSAENTASSLTVSSKSYGYTFGYCYSLKSVEFKCTNLELIPYYAFRATTSLESVVFSNSITAIADYAFAYTGLKNLELPESVTELGKYTFAYSTVENASMKGVSKMGTDTFYTANNLTTCELGDSLTSIPNYTFYGTNLKDIKLPLLVTTLGDHVFRKSMLESIDLSSVTSYGKYVFEGCTKLTDVKLCSTLLDLPKYIFQNCESLTNITLPDSLETMDLNCFQNTGLTSVTIPSKVVAIPNYAFESCTSLVGVLFKGKVASVGNNAFSDCTKLRGLTLSDAIVSIGTLAFENTDIQGKFSIGSNLASLGENPFAGCKGITGFDVSTGNGLYKSDASGALYSAENALICYPNNISGEITLASDLKILRYAFSGCDLITKITIGEGAIEIPDYAFENMAGLEEVVLPSTLIIIGTYAFSYLENLKTLVIPSSVKTIEASAFAYSGLETMTIPGTVESLGTYLFRYCLNLTSVTFEEGIKTLPMDTFYHAEALKTVSLPSTLTSFGTWLFEYSGIEEVTIPEGITTLPAYTFYHTPNLVKVNLPKSITKFDNNVFAYSGIKEFTFPENVKTIGNYCFAYSEVEKVVMSNNITSIGRYTFNYAQSLNDLTLSNSLKMIPQYTFQHTDSLETVILPDSIETIDTYAFAYSGLTNITIPEKVTSIPSYCFQYSSKLTTVNLPSKLTLINSYAFRDCTSIANLYIKSTVLNNIYGYAFNGFTSDQTISLAVDEKAASNFSTTWLSNCSAKIVYSYVDKA